MNQLARLAWLCRAALATALVLPAQADDLSRVMQSRYLRYAFCMEHAFGQGWLDRAKIANRLNRWGVTVATVAGLAAAPVAVRREDARCRKENGVAPLAADHGDGTPGSSTELESQRAA